jgi:hypothetical protein
VSFLCNPRMLILEFNFQTPETIGMIPRAVEQVFNVAQDLSSKGWSYKMEGQFLEIVRFCVFLLFTAHYLSVQRNH